MKMKGEIIEMKLRDVEMKEKVTKLESKNVELQEEITELKLKDVQLETKVKEQEKLLNSMLKPEELQTSTGSKSIFNNLETAIGSTGRSGTPRTCRELRAADPSIPSGMHWIDPDGQGVGDDPIYVYCDMKSGI